MPTAAAPPLDAPVRDHLRTDHARLRAGDTVAEALAAIRAAPPAGRILYFYVVDGPAAAGADGADEKKEEKNETGAVPCGAGGKLVGVVPTRRLVTAALDARVRDLMVPGPIAVPAAATVAEACEFFILHRLLAFPVVDPAGTLLGVVDVSLYAEEIADLDRREANDDLFQLVGVHLGDAGRQTPARAFVTRFPWLLANVAGGLTAALLTGLFEAELRKAVTLALFIPVVLALAESVAIQSVGLSLAAAGRRGFWRTLGGEAAAGALLGLACGAAVGLAALAWLGSGPVVGCVLGGVAGGVTCAAALGTAVPLALRRVHREPQVAAGPVALALTDVATLLIYFGLARWALG